MKIVIDISEEVYKDIIKNGFIYDEDGEEISHAIINGTPLPEHHGRLIDADAFIERTEKIYKQTGYVLMADDVEEEPTIIEGSDSE